MRVKAEQQTEELNRMNEDFKKMREFEIEKMKLTHKENLNNIQILAEKEVQSKMSLAEKTVQNENDRLQSDIDAQRSEFKFLL